ncbi:MAG: hypothetical protein HY619_06360 [Thaumarchaeota archaeon]|nr:hypothetical protein [Nitrososphaerota archaeon]
MSARLFPVSYVKLYKNFREDLFTAEDASKTIRLSKEKTGEVLRRLRGQHLVFSFTKGKYRLLNPDDAKFAVKHLINLNHVKTGRHIHLIVKTLHLLHSCYERKLVSACLYGSHAGGEAGSNSVVNLLLILEEKGGLMERIRSIYQCINDIRFERRVLLEHGLATDVSIYSMTREEAKFLHPIYLEVAEDAAILYDTEGFFQRLRFQSLGVIINSGGVKFKSKGQWFWRMPADFSFGELIGLPRFV